MKISGRWFWATGLLFFTQIALADWTPAKRLTWTAGDSAWPAIAVDLTNNIHVVWYDDTPGNYEIYYKRSTDIGITWSPGKRLTWTAGQSVYPAVALGSTNTIHVVWNDDSTGNPEIFYRNSQDDGLTWSSAKRLTWNLEASYMPAIAIDRDDNISITWSQFVSDNCETYFRRSTNGGATWSRPKRLTWTSGDTYARDIAVDSFGTTHVIWEDDTPGNLEVFRRKSTDGGTTWRPVQRLTWTSDDSRFPALAVVPNNGIHIAWHDYTPGNEEIYYKRSQDGGLTWGVAKRLTWTSAASRYPALAVFALDYVRVVWSEAAPGNFEIYGAGSDDGGATWSIVQRLTWTSGDSREPAMAAGPNKMVYVVWFDNTPGNNEIYFLEGN